MNNLLSLEWLQEFVDVSVKPEELARRLSLVGAGVEHVYMAGSELDNIVVGKIMALEKHPNADALTVCKVLIGNEIKTIVCGGSNLKHDQLVAVALLGARVRWHGAGEPVEIKETELRGVKSSGMIAAAGEIGLETAFAAGEKEILDLEFLRASGSAAVRPGTPLAVALKFHDTIFDIEATSNRPDLMSVVGVAREAVAAGAAKFKKRSEAKLPKIKKLVPLLVSDKKLCPRYIAARVEGVRVGDSPWWLKRRLIAAGVRPINNIVDITNYVRLELGQPMHAFDAAAVNKKLVVRRAQAGEEFLALDKSQHKLTEQMLVIADEKNALCLAGVMGGLNSGVSDGRGQDGRPVTTDIIFEAASFDSVAVRRAARALNLYSDSQLLFEKGLSVQAPELAMARALELVQQIAGGQLVALTDFKAATYKAPQYPFDFSHVEALVGEKIPVAESKKILNSLGFVIKGSGARVKIQVPWWRDHDIETSVDFIEEIARVHGYHNLPDKLPSGDLPDRVTSPLFQAEKLLRQHFVAQGFNETYTYSFVNAELLKKAGLSSDIALKVSNPLNADLTHLRPSLAPSLLKVIAENEADFSSGKIFEVSNVYLPRVGETPVHDLNLAAAVWLPPLAEKENAGAAFRKLKGSLEELFKTWNITAAFSYDKKSTDSFWHPGRVLALQKNEQELGVIGEVHPNITAAFGIVGRVALCLVRVEPLWQLRRAVTEYQPAATFPPAKRDIAFVVDESVAFHKLQDFFAAFASPLMSAELFDVYRGAHAGENKKSLAFHLLYGAADHTLSAEEVELAHKKLTEALQSEFNAEVRD